MTPLYGPYVLSPPIWWKGISRLTYRRQVNDPVVFLSPPIWWKGISRLSIDYSVVFTESIPLHFSTYLVERYFETQLSIGRIAPDAPLFLHLFGGKVFRDWNTKKNMFTSFKFFFLHLFGGKVFRDFSPDWATPVRRINISPPIWWKGISRRGFQPQPRLQVLGHFSTYLVERYFET